jgi:MoaA/NifB/PqqE/SkfB family radical SAM enzyme
MIGMPDAFQINVSSVCNLTCRMCPYLGVHQNDSYQVFMTPETFERLLPAIRRIEAVLFSGSGEPLYNPHLLSFLARVREERPAMRIALTTNGTLLRREVAEELVRLRLDNLTVSIDGATAATVQAIRRKSDFARIVDNVEQLHGIKRERGSKLPRIRANYMVGYGTYGEIPDFVRLAARIGIEEVQLLEIQPSCHDDVRDNLTAGIRRDHGRELRYAIQVGQRLGVSIYLPAVTKDACLFPYHPHIAENGDVYPCCFLDYDGRTLFDGRREVVLPQRSFGNSVSEGFRAVWNSREYRLFRRRTKSGDFPATCTTCYDIRASTAREVARVIGPRPRQAGC